MNLSETAIPLFPCLAGRLHAFPGSRFRFHSQIASSRSQVGTKVAVADVVSKDQHDIGFLLGADRHRSGSAHAPPRSPDRRAARSVTRLSRRGGESAGVLRSEFSRLGGRTSTS